MKNIIALALSAVMLLSFTACANKTDDTASSPSGMPGTNTTVPATNVPTSTPAATPSPAPTAAPEDDQQGSGETSAETIWNEIYEKYGDTFPVTESVPADVLKDIAGIDPEKLESFVFQFPMMNVSASEFFIAQCKEGQLESVKEEVMAHQAALVEQWKQYLPEQLKLVEAYVLETADNYIFFAVAENAEGAADIFKSYFE